MIFFDLDSTTHSERICVYFCGGTKKGKYIQLFKIRFDNMVLALAQACVCTRMMQCVMCKYFSEDRTIDEEGKLIIIMHNLIFSCKIRILTSPGPSPKSNPSQALSQNLMDHQI